MTPAHITPGLGIVMLAPLALLVINVVMTVRWTNDYRRSIAVSIRRHRDDPERLDVIADALDPKVAP